ncbi:MAG: rhomboid family intramembrane serine protease [Bacilli bacterium]|nr:rhomboid family intramembrane serine protease [Bacilli bacterium]
MNITLNENDEIVMRLIHYFITDQGYNPVLLHGAKDEIWLEKADGDYKIIRIVSNYIHNNEQLDLDIYRTTQILKRIKRKMFSFKINALSIFVNLGDNVHIDEPKLHNIECVELKKFDDIAKYKSITNAFPNILEVGNDDTKGLELFLKLTDDINHKNQEENKKVEEIFSKKKPIVTYSLIAINIIIYAIMGIIGKNLIEMNPNFLYKYGALVNKSQMVNNFDYLRIVSSIFLHGGLIHLLCNMYTLYVIGPQVESFFGKVKYILIYLISGICGNLLSMLFLADNHVSIGASGAIFGLLGAIVYFGYHYRVYLGTVIKSQIIPLIVVNLFIGYMVSGINNTAHIGGLIGGVLAAKAVGIKYKSTKSDIINGLVMISIFIVFLIYMVFFR